MNDAIRTVIADDHTIVRSGLRLLLESEPDIEVVGEAGDGAEALKLVQSLQPDVVLIDVAMPVIDGMEATRRIKSQWPEIYVLALTMHRTDEYFHEMLKAGASGYILKGAETNDLVTAIRAVSRGEVYFHSAMARKLVEDFLSHNTQNSSDSATTPLSPREKQILRLLADEYSPNEIAEKLAISPSTVHTHRGNIMTKLGLSNRRELIQYARQHGLI